MIQDQDAEIDPDEVVSIPREEAESKSTAAFKFVFENGPKIELDHHIVYHAREFSFLCTLRSCCAEEEI